MNVEVSSESEEERVRETKRGREEESEREPRDMRTFDSNGRTFEGGTVFSASQPLMNILMSCFPGKK